MLLLKDDFLINSYELTPFDSSIKIQIKSRKPNQNDRLLIGASWGESPSLPRPSSKNTGPFRGHFQTF